MRNHLIRAGVVAAASALTLAATATSAPAAGPGMPGVPVAWTATFETAAAAGTSIHVAQGPLSPFVKVDATGTVKVPTAGACYRARLLRNGQPYSSLGDACGVGSRSISASLYGMAWMWEVQLCRLTGDQVGACGTPARI